LLSVRVDTFYSHPRFRSIVVFTLIVLNVVKFIANPDVRKRYASLQFFFRDFQDIVRIYKLCSCPQNL